MGLEHRVAELERRLGALESEGNGIADAAAPRWALTRLREEFTAAEEPNGGVMFAGTVRLPTDELYGWQAQFSTGDIIDDGDWSEAADCLAALASPVRLRLLREIIGGHRTAAELVGLEGVGTSAEVYQHLRQLAAVGWLHTAGLGRFEVPEGRVVPLLVALASARR
ncbi:ArsR/SmtB family transcription factor [Nocardia sp. NPDC052566]|uniref:ArsR/SmtB family transcription factor n=1 Tax=Nocardia sp. NPDC052566 TaxID=3364330 RepID=UPI0037C6B447